MPETRSGLFRLESVQKDSLGQVMLARPPRLTAFAGVVAALAVSGVAFALLSSPTRTVTLRGQLKLDLGLIRLVTPRNGQILELNIVQGQRVHRGDVLAKVVEDARDANDGVATGVVEVQIHERVASLEVDLARMEALMAVDAAALGVKERHIESELGHVTEEIRLQGGRVKSAQETVDLYASLADRGFVSTMGGQQKREELLDQQMHLSELRISQTRLLAALDANAYEKMSAKQRGVLEMGRARRELSSAREALSKARTSAIAVVVAPSDGVIGSLDASSGQAVRTSDVLATLIPTGAVLVGVFDAPSEMLTLVRPGQAASVRIGALPYRDPGRIPAVVSEISDAPVPGGGATEPGGSAMRVLLRLQSQTFEINGHVLPLHAGTAAISDISVERRPMLSWLFPTPARGGRPSP